MTLSEYLDEMEYAVCRVIESLWHEHDEAESLRSEIKELQQIAADNYRRAQFIQQNAEDPDDVMLGVGAYWDTYFGEDKDQHYKSNDLARIETRLAIREFSYSSLAGTLLQYAKQGLSASFGSPAHWPKGRLIGSQHLKTIILEARNQSEHWEEGKPKERVRHCFDTLASEIGPEFTEYRTKNLASKVVALFGWRSYAAFRSDLLSMNP